MVPISLKEENGPDTTIINRLNKLAAGYFDINPDSTIYYSQKSIALSREINYKPGLGKGLLETGHAYFSKEICNCLAPSKSPPAGETLISIFKPSRQLAGRVGRG